MKHGHSGLLMGAKLDLVLESDTSTQVSLIGQSRRADLFVARKAIEEKTKEISILSNLEQKLGLVAKLVWVSQ